MLSKGILRHRLKLLENISYYQSRLSINEEPLLSEYPSKTYAKLVNLLKDESDTILTRFYRKKSLNFNYKLLTLHLYPAYIIFKFFKLFSTSKAKLNPTEKIAFAMKHEVFSLLDKKQNSPTLSEKFCVYTVITGGYDKLLPIPHDEKCDFICFSDQTIPDTKGWKVIKINNKKLDAISLSRHIKIMPHQYLDNYDFSLYIDGNIQIISNLSLLLSTIHEDTPIAIFKHLFRQNIYDEGEACIQQGKVAKVVMEKQLQKYKDDKTFIQNDMYEANVLFRHHKDPNTIKLMEYWWNEFVNHSKRDQISLPYAIAKTGVTPKLLAGDYICARNHPCLAIQAIH